MPLKSDSACPFFGSQRRYFPVLMHFPADVGFSIGNSIQRLRKPPLSGFVKVTKALPKISTDLTTHKKAFCHASPCICVCLSLTTNDDFPSS